MLCLIKSKYIWGKFHKDIHIIKYQKCSLSYIHLLIFLYLAGQSFDIFQIDKVIYAKLPIIESDSIKELTRIITSVILHNLCGNRNYYLFYTNNTKYDFLKYTKHYFRNFFKKTSILENSFLLY